MLRALCLALTFFLLPVRPVTADAPPALGVNAALKYWQAYATLPRFTDAEQSKLITQCVTMPLDSAVRDLVTRSEYALQMMRRGAAVRPCAWGISYEDG